MLTGQEDKLRNSLQAGHELHWYRIESVLGQGGFGITYLATDTNLDQQVAIKEYLPMELAVREGDYSVYPASQAQDARYKWGLDRFLTEARTLARFKHPSIVRVLSVFEANNTAYMVMEYQHGSSLQQLLDHRRTLPESELVSLVIPLLDGLETIHAQGFIHRDIKPSNLFIRRDGHPVLLDFGSARQAFGEETRTLTSVISPGYAPFEQYYSKSDRQGPWTDIYGLGATLYRCISGIQPMAAIDRSEAILRAERDIFVSASEIGAGQYSASFLAAIDCALYFNEKKRPQSIAEWRPHFDFSTTSETFYGDLVDSAGRDAERTRFSALVDDTVVIDDGPVVNPDVRSRTSDAGGQASLAPTRDIEPDSRSRADPRLDPAKEPLTPSRTTVSSSASTFGSAPQAPSRWWSSPAFLSVIFVLVVVVGAVGYGAYTGLIPNDYFGGAQAARLVARGDRALAAGQAFEPPRTSALAFYHRAYRANPGNADATHGLLLSGQQLGEAITAAIGSGDLRRAEALAAQLDKIPSTILDLSAVHSELAAARAAAGESNKRDQRVREFLSAAAENVINGDLVGSGTDNALARYRAVQILDPENAEAAAGLTALAVALSERGQQALGERKLNLASESHNQARLIDPHAPAVVALGVALESARAAANSEQAKAATIADLLTAAEEDLAGNRLTTPAGDNALESYREVALLDPGNAAAARGIRKIHDRYLAMSTKALNRGDFSGATTLAGKALAIDSDSEPAQSLGREIRVARERRDTEEAQRIAAAAELRAAEEAAAREAAVRQRLAAEQERRRKQEEEAKRLLAIADAKAGAERLARIADEKAAEDAELAKPRLVVDFLGFHPKYTRDGMSRDLIYKKVAPLIRAAGYKIVSRSDVHDAQYKWTNLKLLAYRLNISENTATGLYSYVGSVNVLPDAAVQVSIDRALDEKPLWNRSHNGLGPPTDMPGLMDKYIEMTRAFLNKLPGQRR